VNKPPAPPKDAAPYCDGPQTVLARVRNALREEDANGTLSPALPAEWPPTGEPVVVFYAYTLEVLPTGQELSAVRSPTYRIEVSLADPAAKPRVVYLGIGPTLGAVNPYAEEKRSDTMLEAAAPLLEALCARNLPTSSTELRLRESYGRWVSSDGPLVRELRRMGAAPAFFAWLERSD
jgi:hypothetical protein